MTDKDKTPEELAETHCKALELAQGFDCSKFAWPPAYFTKEELREAFLAGYEAGRKDRIVSFEYDIAKIKETP